MKYERMAALLTGEVDLGDFRGHLHATVLYLIRIR